MKKNQQMLFMMLLIIGLNANAQMSINASGGNSYSNDGSLSYSVCQVFYIQKDGLSGTHIDGIQQPFEIYSLGENEIKINDINIVVYPNPTISKVLLEIQIDNVDNLSFQLFSLAGKLLIEQKILKNQSEIFMDNLSSGVYLLKVFEKTKSIKNFKIIKN